MEILQPNFAQVKITEIRRFFLSLNFFRPGMWLNVGLGEITKLTKFISDESEYEAGYAFGSEIYNDFLFNVGRKTQILKSVIKVVELITFISFFIFCFVLRFGLV